MIRFLAILALPGIAGSLRAEEALRFNRDIRPILSDACFHCHGPDEKERKGGLRLDLAEKALVPGKSGLSPIVPGKPEVSEVLARIHLESDDSDVMPPP
ncbi:MAG: hypothetical protein KDN18_10870, partial [Verrucomicrobiae bacterium]|nr:hypothetical protein [Verrucomicrobiae bacterium]